MSEEIIETNENTAVAEVNKEMYTVEYVKEQLKPLSSNGFVRFFQKIARGWLGMWYGFCDKHPKLSKILQMAFFFIVFSEGVTIWQFIVMTFLPYAFTGIFPNVEGGVGWPAITLSFASNNGATYVIFGDANSWAYFIAFEIAVFTAQCINFPLQRNITFRSHGNPWYQAMWYFIGWVLISIATNAVWGFINCFFTHWGWYLKGAEGLATVAGLIKTVLTGGLSMVVFFFIFLIIFPDNNKLAKSSRAKYEKLVAANAPAEKIVAAENKMKLWEDKATKSNSEMEYFKAKSQVNAAVMKYNAIVKASENPKLGATEKEAYAKKIESAFENAVKTIEYRNEKEAAFEAAKAL